MGRPAISALAAADEKAVAVAGIQLIARQS
jgi:hypothetical protein